MRFVVVVVVRRLPHDDDAAGAAVARVYTMYLPLGVRCVQAKRSFTLSADAIVSTAGAAIAVCWERMATLMNMLNK